MTKRMTLFGVLAAALLALAPAARAQAPANAATNQPKQTVITAGRLTFDHEKMTALFETNVVVVDPDMRLESDRLWVLLDKTNQQINSAKAFGTVKITEKDRVATGDQADYNAGEGKLVLTGNAMVQQERNILRGTNITFWRGNNHVVCIPANMVIFPEKGQSLGSMIQ